MIIIFRRKTACTAAFLIVVLAGLHAVGQTITVMSSGGFSAAYKSLATEFEKSTGVHLESVWGPSMGTTPGAIPVRLAHGENGDVVIMARSALDELAKKGEVVEGSQVDLARSRIGMAVKAGSPVPDISSVEAFRRVLLQAKSVAYSDSASGVFISGEVFKRLGIEKEMAAKSRQIPAEPVGLVVARGEAEIGFQQLSELQPISGITLVGPIPDELQSVTVFSAGIVTRSKERSTARDLIRYLSSPAACPTIKQTALDPVACAASADPLGQMHNPYGEPVTIEVATTAAVAALTEARKNNWTMAVAITDAGGQLVYFEKMNGTQNASVDLAIDKARSAALFRRPTKSFEDALAKGGENLRILAFRSAVPIDGGYPLLVGGKVVGAIGVSGGISKQDGQCSAAGAAAVR
jgi:molybdate transport system substrate-binding protein